MINKKYLAAIIFAAMLGSPTALAKNYALVQVSTHQEIIKLSNSKIKPDKRGYSFALGAQGRKNRNLFEIGFNEVEHLKHTNLTISNDWLYPNPMSRRSSLYLGGSLSYDEFKPENLKMTYGFSAGVRAGLVYKLSKGIIIDAGYYYSQTTSKLDDLKIKNIQRYGVGLAYLF